VNPDRRAGMGTRADPSARISLMGCKIDNLSMAQTLEMIAGFVRSGRAHQHVAVNVDKLVKASRDPALRRIINGCDLVSADGMPVVWASRLLGRPLTERVAGIDLFEALMVRAADEGWRVFLLGAREEIVRRVAEMYSSHYPRLIIAGVRNGYWQDEEGAAVARQIRASRADLLFVAISSPRKEQFLGMYQAEMGVPFAMGVGGSFDVAAGSIKRAPHWMRRAGLEWFYRFLQEPRRMARRYFIDDLVFIWLFIKEVAGKMK
jgi:N-acetylglucosaminyldiphosphoundecaprenol N-acetyl-beta-D-mannosaminyltransferase